MGDLKSITFEQILMKLDRVEKLVSGVETVSDEVKGKVLKEVRAIRGSLKAIGESSMEFAFKKAEKRLSKTDSSYEILEIVNFMRKYIKGDDVDFDRGDDDRGEVLSEDAGRVKEEFSSRGVETRSYEKKMFVVLEKGNERLAFPIDVVERVEDSGKEVRVITAFGIESGNSVFWGEGEIKEMKWHSSTTRLVIVDGKPAVLVER